MSQSSSKDDKEAYSVDEMMERLREGDREKSSSEEGELVTRKDGTQALKVRKRKRRSQQEKEKRVKKAKRIGIVKTLSVIAVPLILGLVVLFTLAFYQRPLFQEELIENIEERVGANVRLQRPSPLINRVRTNSLLMAWPDNILLDQLKVSEVEGDLNPLVFFMGKLRGNELSAREGFLIFSNRQNRKVVLRERQEPEQKIASFSQYKCRDLSIFFGGLNSRFRVENSSVEFRTKEAQRATISLSGGNLVAGNWGKLPIKLATIETRGQTVEIVSLRFESPDQFLILRGDLDLEAVSQSLDLTIQSGTISSFGGEALGQIFAGPLDNSEGALSFNAWDIKTHEAEVECLPAFLEVQKFEFLRSMQKLYGDAQYGSLEFEPTSRFKIARGYGWSEFRDFEVTSIGTLGLRGTVRVENKMLSGQISVGIPAHKKPLIRKGLEDQFYSQGVLENGFFWFPVELSGTTDDPQDNFDDYLRGKKKAEGADLFEQLTQ